MGICSHFLLGGKKGHFEYILLRTLLHYTYSSYGEGAVLLWPLWSQVSIKFRFLNPLIRRPDLERYK